MKTTGQKIKELRKLAGVTREQLAGALDVTKRSIERYEQNQSSPNSHFLSELAKYFDVSADYFLGICSFEKELEISKRVAENPLYKIYLKCRNHYVIEEASRYYWIETDGDTIGGQTEFVKWADEPGGKEIRALREVHPKGVIELCKNLEERPMVINDEDSASAFLFYGGQAIIKKEICEKCLPWYLKEIVVDIRM